MSGHVIEQSTEAGVHKLTVKKDGETYEFRYRDETRAKALRALNRWAADPALDFSWYDAAVASQRIRDIPTQPKAAHAPREDSFAPNDSLAVKHEAELAQLLADHKLEMEILLRRQQEERDDDGIQ